MSLNNLSKLTGFYGKQRFFVLRSGLRLVLLALILLLLWFIPGRRNLSEEDIRLWNDVRAAELHIDEWRKGMGSYPGQGGDPWRLGLIGLEWSPLTTTLGSLEAKRTACNPAWAVAASRWFDKLGLQEGDRIAILSSSSFPGMLLNVLMAAEARHLDIMLEVSLGSSTWGGNDPLASWPLMARELRSMGFLHTRARFYTLGADDELGIGISPEGIRIMKETASEVGVEVREGKSLKDMIDMKVETLRTFNPRVVVSIGGSHANMGSSEDVLSLHPGIIDFSEKLAAGNGVIGRALQEGFPVIHLLNLRKLAYDEGISFNARPVRHELQTGSTITSIIGLMIFAVVLMTHRRWRVDRS